MESKPSQGLATTAELLIDEDHQVHDIIAIALSVAGPRGGLSLVRTIQGRVAL